MRIHPKPEAIVRTTIFFERSDSAVEKLHISKRLPSKEILDGARSARLLE